MRKSKSIPQSPSGKSGKARCQNVAASARLRGMAYTLAVLADLHPNAVEHEVYERAELEYHFRHALRVA